MDVGGQVGSFSAPTIVARIHVVRCDSPTFVIGIRFFPR